MLLEIGASAGEGGGGGRGEAFRERIERRQVAEPFARSVLSPRGLRDGGSRAMEKPTRLEVAWRRERRRGDRDLTRDCASDLGRSSFFARVLILDAQKFIVKYTRLVICPAFLLFLFFIDVWSSQNGFPISLFHHERILRGLFLFFAFINGEGRGEGGNRLPRPRRAHYGAAREARTRASKNFVIRGRLGPSPIER